MMYISPLILWRYVHLIQYPIASMSYILWLILLRWSIQYDHMISSSQISSSQMIVDTSADIVSSNWYVDTIRDLLLLWWVGIAILIYLGEHLSSEPTTISSNLSDSRSSNSVSSTGSSSLSSQLWVSGIPLMILVAWFLILIAMSSTKMVLKLYSLVWISIFFFYSFLMLIRYSKMTISEKKSGEIEFPSLIEILGSLSLGSGNLSKNMV